jgi:uncharacterized lipoprotein YmbA
MTTVVRKALLCSTAGALLLLAGCASAPSRFYSLQATASADGTAALDAAVLVGPVSVPASVDRPEFIVQQGSNRVAVEEFNRWDGPLGDAIARVVAGDLVVLLGTPNVAVAPLANFHSDYRVTIDVQRFQSTPGRDVLLDAVWVVHTTKQGGSTSGRTVAQEPVDDPEYAALAASHSRALARLSADVAAAIRAAAATH